MYIYIYNVEGKYFNSGWKNIWKYLGNIWENTWEIFGEYLGPDHLFGDISAPFPNPQSYILIKMGGGGLRPPPPHSY